MRGTRLCLKPKIIGILLWLFWTKNYFWTKRSKNSDLLIFLMRQINSINFKWISFKPSSICLCSLTVSAWTDPQLSPACVRTLLVNDNISDTLWILHTFLSMDINIWPTYPENCCLKAWLNKTLPSLDICPHFRKVFSDLAYISFYTPPPTTTQTLRQQYLSCNWPDLDQTLNKGSWEHMQQIKTVTRKFVLGTFVHIRNISTVTGLIWIKL